MQLQRVEVMGFVVSMDIVNVMSITMVIIVHNVEINRFFFVLIHRL